MYDGNDYLLHQIDSVDDAMGGKYLISGYFILRETDVF